MLSHSYTMNFITFFTIILFASFRLILNFLFDPTTNIILLPTIKDKFGKL